MAYEATRSITDRIANCHEEAMALVIGNICSEHRSMSGKFIAEPPAVTFIQAQLRQAFADAISDIGAEINGHSGLRNQVV